MNTPTKMQIVMNEFSCGRHRAPNGIPCFHIPKSTGFGFYAAICNIRAQKLFRGQITDASIRTRRHKKEKSK